jgi:hypothetical protein
MKKMVPSLFGSRETRGHFLTDIFIGLSTPVDPHIEPRGFPFAIMKNDTLNRLGWLWNVNVAAASTAEIHSDVTLDLLNNILRDEPIMAFNKCTFDPQSMT